MGWWNCCCGCIIKLDEFDRADGIDLRGSWCDTLGDWELTSAVAVSVVSGANALLNVRHPTPSGMMAASLTTVDESLTVEQTYRLKVNAVKEADCTTDTFYYADFHRKIFPDLSTITLGISSGGVETAIKSDVVEGIAGVTRDFTVTIGDVDICASVTNCVLSYVADLHSGLFADGYYSGMRVSDIGMKVDNFTFYKHFNTDQTCPHCGCRCNATSYFPPRMNVRIYPDPIDCVRLDLLEPCEFEIEWDRLNSIWTGEGYCCGGAQLWRLALSCPAPDVDNNYDPYDTAMSLLVGCLDSCGAPCAGDLYPYEASCSPLNLKYGPYNVSSLDLTCFCTSSGDIFGRGSCNYRIEITDV